MLSEWIYEGQSPDDLIRPAWFGALGIFVLGLVLAIPRDRARVRMLEHGRRLKGPQMVTVKEFNQWSGGHEAAARYHKINKKASVPCWASNSALCSIRVSAAAKSKAAALRSRPGLRPRSCDR